MDTAGAGRLEWSETDNATARDSQTVLQANQLGMKFDDAGKLRGLMQREMSVPNGPLAGPRSKPQPRRTDLWNYNPRAGGRG